LNYREFREVFVKWLQSREYNERWARNVVRYLDRYVKVLRDPLDVALLFRRVKRGRNHMVKSLRVLFNFFEVLGYPEAYLDLFRKALPKVSSGIDLRIPTETMIVDSLRRVERAAFKYNALYNLLVDSGLRLMEAVYVVNNFDDSRVDKVNGFYRCEIAWFRKCKQAYYAHFSEHTLKLLRRVKDKVNDQTASSYYDKFGYVNPKYVRKFAFDKMIDLDIPESIADFIQGRVPRKIGAKHYMALARQAAKFYPRYANYAETLRRKAFN
jgi:intergrase/recombinase